MRVVIVGMGVQGQKRRKVLGKAFKYSVDKFKKADYKFINQIPLDEYDAVIPTINCQDALINKEEKGLALLRLVEIIGEDKIIDMGSETIYFITTILNELNFDKLRNKILLKVLPLKV